MRNTSGYKGVYAYLRVDDFLRRFLDVQSLKSAFETGLIELLADGKSVSINTLSRNLGIDRQGLEVLVGLLLNNKVINRRNDRLTLAASFKKALLFRDLMEAKIEFSNYIAPDLLENFTLSLREPDSFIENSRIFDLFNYHHCNEISDDNVSRTGRWMKYTTILTRYEGPVCIHHHDFSHVGSMLDIGGNSGEFASQVCRFNSRARATVLDLPVVCEIGRQHVRQLPEAGRVDFHAADMMNDELPAGNDLVTFKSVLHDWPEEAVNILLTKVFDCLSPGGSILIFERAKPASFNAFPVYGNLPIFLFIRYYREPDYYRRVLDKSGFRSISIKKIQLEMPFMLVSAKKN